LLQEKLEGAALYRKVVRTSYEHSLNFSVWWKREPVSVLETESSLQAPSLCNVHKIQQDFQPEQPKIELKTRQQVIRHPHLALKAVVCKTCWPALLYILRALTASCFVISKNCKNILNLC